MDITVVIVEDEAGTAEMLQLLVNIAEGYSCIGIFADAQSAVASVPLLQPHVVLMDIHLGGQSSGIEAVQQLKQECPATRFIMCTSFDDTDHIFAALSAGADGYLTKSSTPEKILEAIKDAHQGGAPMNSYIARKVIGSFHRPASVKQNKELEKLSVREREILDSLSRGLSYKDIAAKLFISTDTVRTHISHIYTKLHVNSRTQAILKMK